MKQSNKLGKRSVDESTIKMILIWSPNLNLSPIHFEELWRDLCRCWQLVCCFWPSFCCIYTVMEHFSMSFTDALWCVGWKVSFDTDVESRDWQFTAFMLRCILCPSLSSQSQQARTGYNKLVHHVWYFEKGFKHLKHVLCIDNLSTFHLVYL